MSLSAKEKNHRVLVVDDETDVLGFLKMYLESLGWEVTTAPSVADALRELSAGRFFLVLSDIAMPDMDGYEFVSTIRNNGVTSKIALMTGFGYNPNHTLIKLNKNVRHSVLFKPFDRAKVADTVLKAWMEYHRENPAGAETC